MAILQKSDFAARILLILLFGACAWAMTSRVSVVSSDEEGIVMTLPDQVGEWVGESILFCPSRDCGRRYLLSELPPDNQTLCPVCGLELGPMNHAEIALLPHDTKMVRKIYHHSQDITPISTSIVLSGNDRASIHRPEVCQTAAGHEIIRREIIRIPLADRPGQPLEVMVLDMLHAGDPLAGYPPFYTFYAYWFVGKDRETASHWARYWWMAADRVFRGVSHRWAYIASYGVRNPNNDDHLKLIANYASRLHPQLLKSSAVEAVLPE